MKENTQFRHKLMCWNLIKQEKTDRKQGDFVYLYVALWLVNSQFLEYGINIVLQNLREYI